MYLYVCGATCGHGDALLSKINKISSVIKCCAIEIILSINPANCVFEVNMNNNFVFLNKIQTHILTWGDPSNCNGTNVIVCISGNPGLADFYTTFGSYLHEHTNLPVCVIGQAGHEEVPDKQSNKLAQQEHLFNLDGQIQHKLDLITNYIDNKSRIHLIGHSIGSWLILEILHKNENLIDRVLSVNLLFPTVQRMAESKSGVFLNNVIRNIHTLLMFVILLLYIIPESIVRRLVNIYLKYNCIPQHFNMSVMKFINPKVIEKVLFLAYNEMDRVTMLNNSILEKIKHKTYILYSPRDNWAPVEYMEDMQKFEPALTLKEVNIDHAFVLRSSEKVADMVSEFIKTKQIT